LGAIPKQIERALDELGSRPEQLKLYNSGSFFDQAAIPLSDYEPIAKAVSFARHVVVESHPLLIGPRALRFRDALSGSLEVAIGLETVAPQVLPKLNKRFDLDDFARAAEFLRKHGIGLRVFLLVRPPFMAEAEVVDWTVKSAEFAFQCGASIVSLIPTRPGNGALEALIQSGEFSPPSLAMLEQALEAVLGLKQGRAVGDIWDLERFSNCRACFPGRKSRLETMNLTQTFMPRVRCGRCETLAGYSRT
jgi:radical SAM enzyme (TIGR01210 family)